MFMPACFGAQFDSSTLQDSINDVLGIGARLFDTRLVGVSRIEGTSCTIMGLIDRQHRLRAGAIMRTSDTLCVEMLEQDEPFCINDVTMRPDANRFYSHSLGTPIGAYLGAPLHLSTGRVFGSLWAVHHEPRLFSPADVRMLSLLARLLSNELECAATQKQEKRIEQMMATQAQIDPLTGLFSPDGFMQAVADETSWPHSTTSAYTVATVELHINTLTHPYSNTVHQGFADILMRTVRLIDYCGRLDEQSYAVLLPNMTMRESEAWRQRLHDEIDAWNRVHQHAGLTFNIDMGIADSDEMPGWGQSGTSVMQRAHLRMLERRRVGRAA